MEIEEIQGGGEQVWSTSTYFVVDSIGHQYQWSMEPSTITLLGPSIAFFSRQVEVSPGDLIYVMEDNPRAALNRKRPGMVIEVEKVATRPNITTIHYTLKCSQYPLNSFREKSLVVSGEQFWALGKKMEFKQSEDNVVSSLHFNSNQYVNKLFHSHIKIDSEKEGGVVQFYLKLK